MKIGIFGTGLMGSPLALKLLETEPEIIAYNRTPSKLEALAKAGIETVHTPELLIQKSDCIILILTDYSAIQTVLLNPPSADSLTGKTVIQMGTIAPDESRTLAKEVENRGGNYLEAPVLGSIPEVKSGSLLVMVGGKESLFQDYLPLFHQLSPEPQWIGEVGTASTLKLALNQLIASLTSGFALSLSLIQKEGVDVEKFMGILRESALYAPTFDKKLQRMCDRNFAHPNFPTKHLLKDTQLFLHQAQAQGLDTQGLAGIATLIQKALALGLQDQDYSAIYTAIHE